MLKKLLASALAVATVASCAYVPSALASAATTTKWADAVEYQIWKLKNPDVTEENVTVTVYLAGSASKLFSGIDSSYTVAVKASENNPEKVEEALKKAIKDDIGYDFADTTKLNQLEVATPTTTANALMYVAQVNSKKAVYYSDYDESASAPANTTAEKVAEADVTLLGWYDGATEDTAIMADMYTSGVTAKLAGKKFDGWTVSGNIVKPVLSDITYNYTEVAIYAAKDGQYNKSQLASGIYYQDKAVSSKVETVESALKLPNTDKGNWDTYLANYAKVQGYAATEVTDNATPTGTYVYASLRQMADKTYAFIYKTKPAADTTVAKKVNYTLDFYVDGAGTVAFSKSGTKEDKASYVVTDKADEAYALIKATGDKATLAEYLVAVGGDDVQYVWDGTYKVQSIDKSATVYDVVLGLNVTKAEKYTVYSFNKSGDVVKAEKFLTAKQVTAINDGKATADDLGVAANAVVDSVLGVYTKARINTYDVETMYTMGDSAVAAEDFVSTTGLFNDVAYFGRAAKAGDVVVLKVSFSDDGELKQLSGKVTVEYTVSANVTQVGESFTYSELYPEDKDHKDGVATKFELSAGVNIINATVKYDGKVVTTLAPFYAYVAE